MSQWTSRGGGAAKEDDSKYARVGELGYLTKAAVGCTSQAVVQRYRDLMKQGDTLAVLQVYDAGLRSRICAPLQEGMAVYVEDVSIMRASMKVRPAGQAISYWAKIAAVAAENPRPPSEKPVPKKASQAKRPKTQTSEKAPTPTPNQQRSR